MDLRTYGTIDVAIDPEGRPSWLIDCEPHTMIVLKRVFPSVHRASSTDCTLVATPAAAYELRWFLTRYPMDLEPRALALVDRLAQRQEDRLRVVQETQAAEYSGRPATMAIEPRPYQLAAAELAAAVPGLLVADDVGLGKTITSITAIASEEARPALVVTLTHLPRQWEREVRRCLPSVAVRVVRGGAPHDFSRFRGREVPFPDVVVISYSKLATWAPMLARQFRTVIFDEVQELRHCTSARYAAAERIARDADRRIGLSATPIYNHGGELYNVLEILSPGSLGAQAEFGRAWCVGGGISVIADPAAFGKWAREQGLMIRRTRKDVGRELPPLSTIVYPVETDAEVLEQAAERIAQLAERVLDTDALPLEQMQAAGEMDLALRMATGVAKAPHVAAFVRMLVEGGERVVLYGWHRSVYAVWGRELQDLGVAWYTGTESTAQKDEARRRFVAGEAKVLVISLRSGAGLDGLQHVCRTVVIGELDWSPGVHTQCIGRVARDGQADPVAAYYCVSEDGSDPIIVDILGLKAQQSEGLLNPDAAAAEPLSSVAADRMKALARAYLARHRGRGGAA